MHSRTRLMVLAFACALAPGLLFSATASAASLSVAVEEVQYENEWNVIVTGQADQSSSIQLYIGNADQPCDPYTGVGANGPSIDVPAGSFSKTVNVLNSSGRDLGARHVACAFLFKSGYSTVEASASAPVVSDPPKETISANTNNQLDTAPVRGGLSRWSLGCANGASNEPCDIRGTGTIYVSDATRKKLKLSSTVVAKGKAEKNGVASWLLDFDASKTVMKRLRKATSVPVVFKLKLEEPFARTITLAMKMLVRKGPEHNPSGLRPLYLDWDETGKRIYPRGTGGGGGGGGRG
jgi:hypothetical protein